MIVGNVKADCPEAFSEYGQVKKDLSEREKFLKRQVEDMNKIFKTAHKAFWTVVEDFLETSGRLPSWYDKNKHGLELDHETGVVTMTDKEDNAFDKFLAKLAQAGMPEGLH